MIAEKKGWFQGDLSGYSSDHEWVAKRGLRWNLVFTGSVVRTSAVSIIFSDN